ncbi:MAG: HK97 gp10 family phage protein [Acutalibacteraceae bacterium]|nr:HK97 gp10 family phage protein [Acutalibacteraceae bacterium]
MSDFELTGFDALNEKLEKIARIAPQKINAFVKQEAELLKGDAAQNTPTDTSNLKMGWKRGSLAGGVAVVYNNVDYAAHVEYGHRVKNRKTGKWVKTAAGKTKVVPGAHMLRDAYKRAKVALPEHAELFLEELMKK